MVANNLQAEAPAAAAYDCFRLQWLENKHFTIVKFPVCIQQFFEHQFLAATIFSYFFFTFDKTMYALFGRVKNEHPLAILAFVFERNCKMSQLLLSHWIQLLH